MIRLSHDYTGQALGTFSSLPCYGVLEDHMQEHVSKSPHGATFSHQDVAMLMQRVEEVEPSHIESTRSIGDFECFLQVLP